MLRYLAFVEKGKQKAVMSETLNWVANSSRKSLIEESRKFWTVRDSLVLKGYKTEQATTSSLESAVGHIDWYAEDQLSDRISLRSPNKSNKRYIPLAGIKKTKRGKIPKRKSPAAMVGRALNPRSKVFFIRSKKQNASYIAERPKRTDPLVWLYKLVPKQRIVPKVSMTKITQKAAGTGQDKFNVVMAKSIKPFN